MLLPPLLEGPLGIMALRGCTPAAARHFVLRPDMLDCYDNARAQETNAPPLESFKIGDLKDLTDGTIKVTVTGESVKIFFIDPTISRALRAAIKQATSQPGAAASTLGIGPASARPSALRTQPLRSAPAPTIAATAIEVPKGQKRKLGRPMQEDHMIRQRQQRLEPAKTRRSQRKEEADVF